MSADPVDSPYRITTDTSNDEDSDTDVQVQRLKSLHARLYYKQAMPVFDVFRVFRLKH